MPFKHGRFVPPPQPDMTPPILRKAEWMNSWKWASEPDTIRANDVFYIPTPGDIIPVANIDDVRLPITVKPAIPDDLMALAADAEFLSLFIQPDTGWELGRVGLLLQTLKRTASVLTPETRKLIEDYKEKQDA